MSIECQAMQWHSYNDLPAKNELFALHVVAKKEFFFVSHYSKEYLNDIFNNGGWYSLDNEDYKDLLTGEIPLIYYPSIRDIR
jgi:hypothetical protein